MRSAEKATVMMLVTITLILLINILATASAQNDPTLTVTVYTQDEKPLANAYIELKEEEARVDMKKTGSDGKVSFNVYANETYSIYVYYPPGHLVGSSSISVSNESLNVSITVDVVSKWVIYVYDKKERDPVPNAEVFLVHQENDSITYSKLTGSDGKVEFGPLPSDSNYYITVEFKGKNYSIGAESIPSDGTPETKLTLPLFRVTLSISDRKGSPVEGVEVELREELDEEPAAEAVSGSDGVAVMKLIPTNTEYYVLARLKGIIVYQSDGKEIRVLNDDVSKEIIVNAVRLNITVMDYDGEEVLENYHFIGKLIKNGEEVSVAESEGGVLHFGHTPFETYSLEIMLGGLPVYSDVYEVDVESAEGSVNAWFYDVKIRVNASALVNASLTRSLSGELRTSEAVFEFEAENWEASISNVPKSSEYVASLYYSGREILRVEGLEVYEENQVLWLNLTGYELNVTTVNLDGEPVSAEIKVILQGVGTITSFQTGRDGRGSSGTLLPLQYRVEAYFEEIEVGEETVDLTSDKSISMTLSLKTIAFKIFDRDGEEALGNLSLKLMHEKISRNGEYIGNGTLIVENLPISEYRLTVMYYGFKVLDDVVDIGPDTDLLEFKAPGVLDLELIFLDSDMKPLDQGEAIVSFSGYELKNEIDQSGRAVFKNLPNITIEITAYYKGIEIKLEPKEIDLVRDNMRATIRGSVHSFSAKILRGDGKPLNEGQALLYIDDMLLSSHDLSESNEIAGRLPEGNLRIEIKYRGRGAGLFDTYLEKSMRDLSIYSTVYPVEIMVRSPDGGVVSGARLIVEDDLGTIADVVSGGDGVLRLLLPAAETYRGKLVIGNDTYSLEFGVEKSKSLSFLYPAPPSMGFELTIAASAANLAISGYAISRLPRGVQRPRSREVARRARRIPRV